MASGAYRQYDICESGTHVQATSTGIGDVKSFAAPTEASGCFITCETTACRITVDGSAPSAGNGLVIPAATSPVFLPIGHPLTLKAAGSGGTSVINVLWLR